MNELPKQKAFDFWLDILKEGDKKFYLEAVMWFRNYFDELLNNINV